MQLTKDESRQASRMFHPMAPACQISLAGHLPPPSEFSLSYLDRHRSIDWTTRLSAAFDIFFAEIRASILDVHSVIGGGSLHQATASLAIHECWQRPGHFTMH